MAEFCLKCFNKYNGMELTEADVTLEDDLCEGCGMMKPCVVSYHLPRRIHIVKNDDSAENTPKIPAGVWIILVLIVLLAFALGFWLGRIQGSTIG